MFHALKVTFVISLLAGVTWWVVTAVPQPGPARETNQPLLNQKRENVLKSEVPIFDNVDNNQDKTNTTLAATSPLTFTPAYTVYLPLVFRGCIPSPPGESNNVADALTICSGRTVSGQVNDSDFDDVYKIFTEANQTLTISMNGSGVGGPGDADLYLYPPGTTDIYADPFVDSSISLTNNEFIQGTVLVGGFWYIDVFDCCDGDGGTNYNLTAILSGPGGAEIQTFDLTGTGQARGLHRNKSLD